MLKGEKGFENLEERYDKLLGGIQKDTLFVVNVARCLG